MIERAVEGNVAPNGGVGSDSAAADRLRESVSALFDGEATELEVRRLLSNEPAMVRAAWRDYQLQRDAIQGTDLRFASFDISARVRAAIDDEDAPALANAAASGGRWWRPLASMAVAASVATVVVIGARGIDASGGFDGRGGNMVAQQSTVNPNVNRVHAALGNVSASVQPFGPLAAGYGLPGTVFPRNEVVGNGFPGIQNASFDAEQIAQQQRRQRYLLRQSERAALNNHGVISFAKVSELSEE